ncbi:MAG: hypothetical protein R3B09_10960 [Nannocystaceae bacterium]
MNARRRFLQTRSGVTAFAEVEVRLVPAAAPAAVDRLDPAAGACAPSWIAAALRGALRVAEALVARGRIAAVEVQLVSLRGSPVDTREDAVECAAALAVWEAAAILDPPPEPVFAAGRWSLPEL